MTGKAAVKSQVALKRLAKDVNEEHRATKNAFANSLQHAIRCGRLLMEAKAQVAHGEWAAWIARHCEFTPRAASRYMRIAREFPRVPRGNRTGLSDLSVTAVTRLLAAPRQSTAGKGPTTPPIKEGEGVGDEIATRRAESRPAAYSPRVTAYIDALRQLHIVTLIDGINAAAAHEFSPEDQNLVIALQAKLREVFTQIEESFQASPEALTPSSTDSVVGGRLRHQAVKADDSLGPWPTYYPPDGAATSATAREETGTPRRP